MGAHSSPQALLLRLSRSLDGKPSSANRDQPVFMRVTIPLDVKAIVLADEVLYDTTAWWRWLAQRLSRLDMSVTLEMLYPKWRTEFLPDVREGKRDRWAALNELLTTIGLNRAQAIEVIASSKAPYRRMYGDVHPLPGTVETLTRLANQRIRLVLLRQSRDSLDDLNRTLQQWGVRQDFDFVIDGPPESNLDSQAEFFAGICRLLELPATSVAFVGRDESELSAASAIGFTTIDCEGNAGQHTDLSITRIASLIGIVQQLPKMRQAA